MQETREERFVKSLRELAQARREMRLGIMEWKTDRLTVEFQTLRSQVTSITFKAEYPGRLYPRSFSVQKYRMVKNEVKRRRLEVN